jgi:hypothetical protein
MNIRVPYNAGKLSSGNTTGELLSSAQLHVSSAVHNRDNMQLIHQII